MSFKLVWPAARAVAFWTCGVTFSQLHITLFFMENTTHCLYVCLSVCLYVCRCVYVWIYMCESVYLGICFYGEHNPLSVSVFLSVCMSVSVGVCVYGYVYLGI